MIGSESIVPNTSPYYTYQFFNFTSGPDPIFISGIEIRETFKKKLKTIENLKLIFGRKTSIDEYKAFYFLNVIK